MIETIEDNQTETQPEFLNWEESFGLFCSINKDIEFLTEMVNHHSTTATHSASSLEFWNDRLSRLVSAKAKLRKGIPLSTSTIKFFSWSK